MNKTVRTIATITAALALTIGAGITGYTAGTASTAQKVAAATQSAQCEAIRGLQLTPQVPYKTADLDCVWPYQTTLNAALSTTGLCLCGD